MTTDIKIPLKKGDKGNDVLLVQQFLNSIQGATHPIAEDGIFGTATESLVKNFQQRETLKTDGIVGTKTLEAMCQQGFTTATEIKIPLKKGDKGNDVLLVQQFLNSIQGATHPPAEDGIFGTATESLVKNFQQRETLKTDG
ncbi:MAG: peptidoglycan-binding protein, partial [Rivularia sp. (in: cyanobacteria)]